MNLKFRIANAKDASYLSGLALRAKAYWPYDQDFIRDCADDLRITESRASGGLIVVAGGDDSSIIGFYGFGVDPDSPEMTHLFVEPSLIGKGVGHQLWKHALTFADEKGWRSFKLLADPYAAEKFYFRVGCKKIGEVESSVRPGRMLPLLLYEL